MKLSIEKISILHSERGPNKKEYEKEILIELNKLQSFYEEDNRKQENSVKESNNSKEVEINLIINNAIDQKEVVNTERMELRKRMNELMKDLSLPNNNNNASSINNADKIIVSESNKININKRPTSGGCIRKINSNNQRNNITSTPPIIDINSNDNINKYTEISVNVHQGYYHFINSIGNCLNNYSCLDINTCKFNGFIEESIEVNQSFEKINLIDYNINNMDISCNDINISNNIPAGYNTELMFHLLAPKINNEQHSLLLLSILSDACRSLLV